jgi:hypothetical protein
MKTIFITLFLIGSCILSYGNDLIYRGCTPAHPDVRKFLGISLTDSIDFIRWKIVVGANRYELDCRYGLSKANTNGFVNERKHLSSGELMKHDYQYTLRNNNKNLHILAINPNLLHLLDNNKKMLVGNGGYSYTLNTNTPIKTDKFNLSISNNAIASSMAFEGRTPCQELAKLMVLNKSADCIKMKWYIIFNVDPVTKQHLYKLKGGLAFRQENKFQGEWEIIKGKEGRVIYKLKPESGRYIIYLLKADDNILLFTDQDGNLLVGNEDFSYTLNRTRVRG